MSQKELFIKNGKPNMIVDTEWRGKKIPCTILQDTTCRGLEKVYFITKSNVIYEIDYRVENDKYTIILPNEKSVNANYADVEDLVNQLLGG